MPAWITHQTRAKPIPLNGHLELLVPLPLAKEHVHQACFRTREEAKAAVFDYVEVFYNRQRLHSGVGYRTPAEAHVNMMSEVAMAIAA